VIVTGGEVEVSTTVLLPVVMSWNASLAEGRQFDPVPNYHRSARLTACGT
jgi:hypothetical protein